MLQNRVSQNRALQKEFCASRGSKGGGTMSTTAKIFIALGVIVGALLTGVLIGAHEVETLMHDELDSFI